MRTSSEVSRTTRPGTMFARDDRGKMRSTSPLSQHRLKAPSQRPITCSSRSNGSPPLPSTNAHSCWGRFPRSAASRCQRRTLVCRQHTFVREASCLLKEANSVPRSARGSRRLWRGQATHFRSSYLQMSSIFWVNVEQRLKAGYAFSSYASRRQWAHR